MALPLSRSVLSLQGVIPAERRLSATPTRLDLELPRGVAALLQVDDEADASALVDLCVGLVDPGAGRVRFLGVDWTTRNPRERLTRRRRIGAIVQAGVWPSHMTVLEAVLMARFYHFNRPPDEVIADATELARLFGLPGLPVGRSETTPLRALIRAACVRGFLGSPDLIVVHDRMLDHPPALPSDGSGDLGRLRQGRHGSVDHDEPRRAGRRVRPRQSCVPPGRRRPGTGTEVAMKRSIFGLHQLDEIVGAVVLACIGVFIAVLINAGLLKDWFQPSFTLRILLPDEGVSGLAPGAEVQVLGTRAARSAASSSIPASACTPSPGSGTRCGRSSAATRRPDPPPVRRRGSGLHRHLARHRTDSTGPMP